MLQATEYLQSISSCLNFSPIQKKKRKRKNYKNGKLEFELNKDQMDLQIIHGPSSRCGWNWGGPIKINKQKKNKEDKKFAS